MFLGLRSLHEGEPDGIGFAVNIGDDLDALAIRERIIEGHHLTIDLGDGEFIPELGVDRISEIDWR